MCVWVAGGGGGDGVVEKGALQQMFPVQSDGEAFVGGLERRARSIR